MCFGPTDQKKTLPHPITIQNIRFRRYNLFLWGDPFQQLFSGMGFPNLSLEPFRHCTLYVQYSTVNVCQSLQTIDRLAHMISSDNISGTAKRSMAYCASACPAEGMQE